MTDAAAVAQRTSRPFRAVSRLIAAAGLAALVAATLPGHASAGGSLPDLVVRNFYRSATFDCVYGQPLYEFKATVKNIGTAPSAPALVQVLEDAPFTTMPQPQWGNGAMVGGLQPGESGVVTIRVYPRQLTGTFPNGMTDHSFRARVDPANVIKEINDGNNATYPLSVFGYEYCK